MLRKIKQIIMRDFSIAYQANYILINSCLFLVLSSMFPLASIVDPIELPRLGPFLILLISIILNFNYISQIYKEDFKDGSLELLLINYDCFGIVTAKIISHFTINYLSAFLILPIIKVFYNLSFEITVLTAINLLNLLLYTSFICNLLALIDLYFKYSNNLLMILIFPLLIPVLILSSLNILNFQNGDEWRSLLSINCGITFVLAPVFTFLSSKLLKNIYHI